MFTIYEYVVLVDYHEYEDIQINRIYRLIYFKLPNEKQRKTFCFRVNKLLPVPDNLKRGDKLKIYFDIYNVGIKPHLKIVKIERLD